MKKEDKATLILNETHERLATIFANIVDEKITQVEKASGATYKDSLHTAISSASKDAISKFEREQKGKYDPAAVEKFKGWIDGNVEGMLKDIKDFSGNKSQEDMSQIATLRERLDNYKAYNGIESKKLSSLETWNSLVDKIDKVTKENLDRVGEKLKEVNPNNAEIGPDSGKLLKDHLHKSLEAGLENIVANQKLTKNLDPEAVKAFQQNINSYVAHVLEKTSNFSGTSEAVKGEMDNLKKEVDSFKKKVTVDPNNYESNWKKVAEFCESKKMDGLAKFCHAKHAQVAAKELSKELKVDLEKHKDIFHDSSKKPFMPGHGNNGRQ